MHLQRLLPGHDVRLVPIEAPSPNAPYARPLALTEPRIMEETERFLDPIRLHNYRLYRERGQVEADPSIEAAPAWALRAVEVGYHVFRVDREGAPWFLLAEPRAVLCCDGHREP